jgi:hypothetical protein
MMDHRPVPSSIAAPMDSLTSMALLPCHGTPLLSTLQPKEETGVSTLTPPLVYMLRPAPIQFFRQYRFLFYREIPA